MATPATKATTKPTTKPAAKPVAAQAAEAEKAVAPRKKSKKKLILLIVAVVLLVGGGAAAFLLLNPDQAPRNGEAAGKARQEMLPKFIDLGQFTANLMREESDRYLQVSISLKITKPDLEDKIKENKPEILHRINMLLQSKYPSELATFDGKENLAQQIRAQAEFVLGLRKTAPIISAEGVAPIETGAGKNGITDVLFTSFIIQ